jgi:hypothetical protein
MHAGIEEMLETVFSVRSMSRLFKEEKSAGSSITNDCADENQLDRTGQSSVRKVRGWFEMAVSLRGREPGNSETSTVGRCYQAAQ